MDGARHWIWIAKNIWEFWNSQGFLDRQRQCLERGQQQIQGVLQGFCLYLSHRRIGILYDFAPFKDECEKYYLDTDTQVLYVF